MIAGVADTGNQFISPLSITLVCKTPFHTETYSLFSQFVSGVGDNDEKPNFCRVSV